MIARVLFIALALASTSIASAQNSGGLFTNQEPTPAGLVIKKSKQCESDSIQSCREIISVSGDFTPDSGSRLSKALQKMQEEDGQVPSNIYLNSPGGVLTGALGFGAVVRSSGLNTVIGSKMRCFSACAYAFLGGVSRTVEEGGQFGVHRFFSREEVSGAVEMSQQTMAMLSSFVENMGASPDIIRLSASAGQNSMAILTPIQNRDLRVDNTFPTPQPWSIQTRNDTLEMMVRQYSAFNDRQVQVLLRPEGRSGIVTVTFQEPKAFSRSDNKIQTQANPQMTLCRVNLRTQEVRKCIDGSLLNGWQPTPEERTFAASFSFGLKQVSQLLDGPANERLVVSIKPSGQRQPMVIVATSIQGFSTAFKAVVNSQ